MILRTMLRAAWLAAIPVLSAVAQPRTAPSQRPVASCAGQRIGQIVVYSEAPSVANLRRVPVLAAIARTLHTTTRPELISRFLLLAPGEPCEEIRRAESERILRAQPYIADADVFVVANDQGGVDLEVHTSDEASMLMGGSVRARAPVVTYLLLGNSNLGGQGVLASASWRSGEGFRDGIAARVIDRQFLGRPWVMALEGERASYGHAWRVEGVHPFYTDLQRTAWRVRSGTWSNYVELRKPDGTRPLVALRRNFFDVGGMGRVGPVGRLNLFGLSFSGDDERAGERLISADTGVFTDRGALPRIYEANRIARVNLLWGIRNIRFERRDGIDALSATQDVPVGFQLGTQIGRSMHAMGARTDDMFLSTGLYAGSSSEQRTLRLQIMAEGRRGRGEGHWDGVLATGRLTQHVRLGPNDLNQVNLEWSRAHRMRTPFQLLFGVPDGGIRGWEESSLVGGERLVLRFEQRHNFGQVYRAAEAGVALFSDVGQQWARDVPFGTTTDLRASLGISLLANLPAHSPRTWRADLAVPVGPGAGARWTLKFSNSDRTRFVFNEPRDVREGRELSVPASLFAWP